VNNLDHNPLRDALKSDEPAVGAVAKVPSPTLIEVYGDIGLDFAFVDLEHGGPSPYDSDFLEHVWRAAAIGGIERLVRLPTGDPPLVRRVFDTGVRSVLVPRVETAAEVRAAVEASRFEYDGAPGERGFVSGCQANAWGSDLDGYIDRQDDTALVGVIVETAAAVENIEAIVAVPDLGFVFVGRRDLTVSLGHRGEVNHPDVAAAVETVREECLAADVPLGGVAATPEEARAAVDSGFRLLLTGYELDAVRDYFGRWLDGFDT
jgi:2-dehydro-3-deoxyglucarate aldolase